ncbi:MAG: acyltransferase [Syntrophobacteraceae bacterium]|nr:acyltransferase [Syntrophobacteraceae bacterium]
MGLRLLGRISVGVYRLAVRARSKLFSLMAGGAFSKFGKKSVIVLPIRLHGEGRIEINDRVFIGANCWLQTLPDDQNTSPAISIGSQTSIAGSCVISAVRQVRIGKSVLFARNVYVSDHKHKYSDPNLPIIAQGVDKVFPVVIKEGAWIGQNVIVCPGVTIGRGAVIGANSLVNKDIPDYCLAAGSPVAIIRKISESPDR